MVKIEKQIRPNTPQVGVKPYGQIHAHSTGNPSSTAQNEADYHMRRPINSGFFSHIVGNGRVIQTAPVNRGAYDVGGGWNAWGYAQVELIESHKTQAEFETDYKIYVDLLRSLAKEAGIPLKLDSGNTGILTHEYCTYHQPNNKSDHVDPYPYLKKRGISREQFKKDIENGISAPTSKPTASTSFKVGDKVKITDALYKDSTGVGRSTASRGKTGTIKRVVSGNKPYLIDSLGWAHKNDIQLVTSSTTTATKKVGDTVTVQSHATQYQTGQNIPSWVKGKKYKIKQIKSVNQSKSKKAYLLDGINSWFLEQDVK